MGGEYIQERDVFGSGSYMEEEGKSESYMEEEGKWERKVYCRGI